jgi:hypothetical protein
LHDVMVAHVQSEADRDRHQKDHRPDRGPGRAARGLFHAAALFSAMTFLAVAVLWPLSLRGVVGVERESNRHTVVGMAGRGGMQLVFYLSRPNMYPHTPGLDVERLYRVRFDPDDRKRPAISQLGRRGMQFEHHYTPGSTGSESRFLRGSGFTWYRRSTTGLGGGSHLVVGVPFWLLLLLSLPLMLLWRRRVSRWSRQRLGLCLRCGYDLTANLSGTCPECGGATLCLEIQERLLPTGGPARAGGSLM